MHPLALLALLALVLPAAAGCLGQARDDLQPASQPVRTPRLPPAEPVRNLTNTTVESPVVLPPPPPPEVLPRVSIGALKAHGTDALVWKGPALHARPDGWAAPCDPVNCLRVPFELKLAPGYWEGDPGQLEVTVAWGGHEGIEFALRVLDAKGEALAEGAWGEYATVALLDAPPAGAYVAEVRATERGGDFWLVGQVEPRPAAQGEPRDLLPNLKALVPKDISLTSNNYFLDAQLGRHKWLAYDALGLTSCGLDEKAEGGAQRCLRFASAVGNVGEGPLEVHLLFPEGQAAIAGQAQFLQRIHRTDGTWRDVPAGPAEYHPTHGHLHYQGLAHFQLYAYSWEGKARGEPVTEGRKAGFCMVDEGLVRLGALGTVPSNYTDLDCDYTSPGTRLMRISPGWFDMYEVNRPDQYVDIEGLPDGVYELVARADEDDTILESDESDNEASVVFRLTGEAIEVLASAGEEGPFGSG